LKVIKAIIIIRRFRLYKTTSIHQSRRLC